MKTILFHFKRDLRLHDNAGLYHALKRAEELSLAGSPTRVIGLFVFDTNILNKLPYKDDRRLNFILHQVVKLQEQLRQIGSDLLILHGDPLVLIPQYFENQKVNSEFIHYYANFDDDPYPLKRDAALRQYFESRGAEFKLFKDHLIFARGEVLSQQHKPYTVYTPYKKAWLAKLSDPFYLKPYPTEMYYSFFAQAKLAQPPIRIESLGFKASSIKQFLSVNLKADLLAKYAEQRDFPFLQGGTSLLGVHLRFGTVSPREVVRFAAEHSEVFVSEIAWRDFFAQILFHFPYVVKQSFRPIYEQVPWRTEAAEFELWSQGLTGYPLVDAGMRELNQTGHMHNRVRMVVASFLCKHLLHHWYEGERYFAGLLMDYDLASNNGNWQWAAGTGCDAAPYFRVFNPQSQMERFDPEMKYIKLWVPEIGTAKYPKPMVEHSFARSRALDGFKKGLGK